MAEKDDYLADILVDLGFVSAEKVAETPREAEEAGVGLVDLLVANKVVRPADVTQAKASHFGAEVVNLSEMQIADDVLAAIPRHIARKYRVVPVFKHDNSLTVALADPSDLDTIDSLTHLLRAEIDLRVASEADIEGALSKYYAEKGGVATDPRLKEAIEDLTREHVELEAAAATDGGVVEADAPLIKLVNSIIVEAFKMRASDIHLEPLSKTFRMRYRIDGVLHEMKAPPKRLQAAVISRLKIQSNMSICRAADPAGRAHPDLGGGQAD